MESQLNDQITTEEGVLPVQGGVELYTKTWHPAGHALARAAFVHGYSDHSNAHDVLFNTLARKGIAVYAFDGRGWGRSVKTAADRGRTGPSSLVMDDITAFINTIPTDDGVPLFVMGHSMGGAEILTYAATAPGDIVGRVRGFVAMSPFIGLHPASTPNIATIILGRLAGRLFPNMQMYHKIETSKLARDPDVAKRYEKDPLCHQTGTLQSLAAMLDRADALSTGEVRLPDTCGEGDRTRLLMVMGTADEICSYIHTRNWYEQYANVVDKDFFAYDGWYHKLHEEPGDDKIRVSEDIAGWILDRTAPLVPAGPEQRQA